MLKKILVILVVALVALVLGIGGGYFLGAHFGAEKETVTGISKDLEHPGPIVDFGDFVINLADKEPHLANFELALEASNTEAKMILTDGGWRSHIRNEVLLTVKDHIADDFRSAEGIMELSDNLKRRLNAILPTAEGRVVVRRVLFRKFVTQ
ncbi:MAG: flagellar basal body protein FliL [Dethiosulfovibrio peptidovorans]|nr:MAG: flagellar basal body protein FliL [Dethiosulfovibrio peptidovorans]